MTTGQILKMWLIAHPDRKPELTESFMREIQKWAEEHKFYSEWIKSHMEIT